MKRIVCWVLCLVLLLGVTTVLAEDAFDTSADTKQVEELGVPTLTSVAELKSEADSLWSQEKYDEAAVAYAIYAKQVNWLANLVSAGLDPFYNASSSDRKDYYPSDTSMRVGALASHERKANEYKEERNRAIMQEGLCYYYLNDYESALPLLLKALDLFSLDEVANWQITMNALYTIIGY